MLSPEIIEQRRGSITASAVHRIMAGWNTPKPSDDYPSELYQWIELNGTKPLVGDVKGILKCDVTGALINAAWKAYQFNTVPQGLITYAEELACDELFEHDPMTDVSTRAMDIGNEREPEAVDLFIELTGLNLVNVGDDQLHLSLNGIGATPDGIIRDDIDLIEAGAEIKSRIPLHHARQLLINDNKTLIENDFERYCQIQTGIAAADVDRWYSINYNPYAKELAHRLHWCVIKRDQPFIDIINQRAEVVYEHKERFLNKLLAVKNPSMGNAA